MVKGEAFLPVVSRLGLLTAALLSVLGLLSTSRQADAQVQVVAQADGQRQITMPVADFAKLAITRGEFDLAREVLLPVVEAEPANIEARFLLAEIDAQRQNYPSAVARYRDILKDNPGLLRVRLDLAAALFQMGEDESSAYNFRLVLASPDLPENVRANVMDFLTVIRKRKKYDLRGAFSVSPDTNINAGTGKNEITLFGLPFTPSATTKQKSGVGIVASAYGEYRIHLGDNFRLRANTTAWRAEYPTGAFDDTILNFQAGPQYVSQYWDISLLTVVTRRWFGNDPFSVGVGPRVEATYSGFERWNLNTIFQYQTVDYHSQTFQNGDTFDVTFYPRYFLSTTSYVWPILGLLRTHAADPAFSNFGYRLGAGYHQELAGGITFELQPEFLIQDFKAASATFGSKRRDRMIRASVSLYNRTWSLWDFSPVFNYTYTNNISNQGLFGYQRHQVQFGLTKEY